ncbi:MAG: hypothetical protein L0271_14005 [Gemmatimonadetes bacterium]|nr:hypothetical protein [Gemmatimonadota bacterium]
MSRPLRYAAIGFAALACVALEGATAAAQRVVFSGRGPIETDTIITRLTRTSPLTVLTADTVIPPADTVRGPVLIAGTTIKLEGVLDGDVVIVDANLFLRPHSRITGSVINVGGGLFPSDEARVDGEIRDYRDVIYFATREDGGVHIRGSQAQSLVDGHGLRGLAMPAYDRVNALTIHLGATLLLPRAGRLEPDIVMRASYATARERPGGRLEFGIRGGDTRFALGVERTTVSNESWIRAEVVNSLSFLFGGTDYRNHREIDRGWASITRSWGGIESLARATIGVQRERSRSLRARDPFTIIEPDSLRSNPSVDPGRISSAWTALSAEWERPTIIARADGLIEHAEDMAGGEHSFTRFDVGGFAAMRALANHTLQVEWRFRGPLPGTDILPRQRWSAIGGRGTLYHLGTLAQLGDRLVYVEAEYAIPLPQSMSMAVLGRPAIEVIHHAGKVWTHDRPRDLEHSLGLRVRTKFFWAMGVIDPTDSNEARLLAGFTLPRRYPWWPRD